MMKDNKLIAEFMGAKIEQGSHGFEYARFNDEEGFLEYNERLDNLKYHTSWDWQIPAYTKLLQELRKILLTCDDGTRRSITGSIDFYAKFTINNDIERAYDLLVNGIRFVAEYNKILHNNTAIRSTDNEKL